VLGFLSNFFSQFAKFPLGAEEFKQVTALSTIGLARQTEAERMADPFGIGVRCLTHRPGRQGLGDFEERLVVRQG